MKAERENTPNVQLKGFAKVFLEAGEEKAVEISLRQMHLHCVTRREKRRFFPVIIPFMPEICSRVEEVQLLQENLFCRKLLTFGTKGDIIYPNCNVRSA
ncbi:MAG: fibronectin type III-like domain-contianing protein [Lachnospiraceae bacterium]|nr:fibronectin type III-like domain-contianing protein [Lachnospiraceae bacterium]